MGEQDAKFVSRGYYSLVQYCPDPSRLEAVNLGVALLCPEQNFLRAKFSRRKTKLSQFFGVQDWEYLDLQMRGLSSRLEKELESIRKVEDFANFAARRADAIRLTPPRPMQVEDRAELVLDTLVQRLVASKAAQRSKAKVKAFRQELGREFENAGLANLVQRDVEVSAPLLPAKFEAPFAFQNGKLNLIAPRDFTGSSEKKIFDQVSVLAVQGGVLADYHDPKLGDLGLIVVGRFDESHKEDESRAHQVLQRQNVRLVTEATIPNLIEEIRAQAHN
jgi:hypothetical protein